MLLAWTCWGLGPGPSACKTVVIVRDSSSTRAKLTQYVEPTPYIGDGHPNFNTESLEWVYKPLLLVDDPSTYEDCETCMDIIQPLHRRVTMSVSEGFAKQNLRCQDSISGEFWGRKNTIANTTRPSIRMSSDDVTISHDAHVFYSYAWQSFI